MRIVGFVQGRIGSTRLPKKVMLDILGRPMIWHVWNRVAASKFLDEAIILTSTQAGNEVIVDFAKKEGIPCFAGSETDLLERYYDAAKKFNASVIVRVTADCPLIDPDLIDDLIQVYKNSNGTFDYLSNARPQATYPHGLDVELFTFSALERAYHEVTDPFRREWLTTNFFEHPEKYRQKNLRSPRDLSCFRLTVDYQSDFDLVRKIFTALYRDNAVFKLKDILALLEQNPELMKACVRTRRHDGYADELAKQGGVS